ncbi:MAG: CD225/dispanin family protein [Pseudoflavonifractor sp.]|nr:CD225/dispanin family protein [Alloprevotella sp.]MCM1117259.1 CD225/dispanin family protein [Pseudoflavonifractor sp.]
MKSRITPGSYGKMPEAMGLRILPCPPTWAIQSLLVTIFMCLPLGAMAMYFSSKVEEHYALGRYDDAAKASDRARTLIAWCLYIGTVAWLVAGWLWFTGTLRPSFLTFTI